MAQTAMLTLIGRQRDQNGEESVTETRAKADYYEKGGAFYILYEEVSDDSTDVIKTTIKYRDNVLEMAKRGSVRTRMIFQAGQTHRTDYVTPYGILPLEVATRRAEFSREVGRVEIRLEYALSSDRQLLSECSLHLRLRFL